MIAPASMSEGLAIELDREDGRYRAGDRLAGAVRIEQLPEDARGIELVVKWCTRGDGNVDTAEAVTTRLSLGGVPRGKRARVPFSVALPPGPVTYHGQTIHVEWFVSAQLDLPWARDPRVERGLELLPREAGFFLQGGGGYREAAVLAPVRHALGPAAPAAGSRKPRGEAGAFFFALASAAVATQFGVIAYVLTPLLLFGAGSVLVRAIKRTGDEHMLGDPIIELAPAEVRGGQEVLVRLRLEPRAELHLTEANAELRCTETTKKGSGSSTTTNHQLLSATRHALAGPDPIAEGQAAVLEARVPIPAGAAPSFGASSNEVIWSIKLVLKAYSQRKAATFSREIDEEIILLVQPG